MTDDRLCYGCRHLRSQPDDAGGGLYLCRRARDQIVGAYGAWTTDVDEPTPLRDDCWEEARRHA